MSSIIPLCVSAADLSLGSQSRARAAPGHGKKANKNRHNSTGDRHPGFVTAVQQPTPIRPNPLMRELFLMKLAASHGKS
jgi:hypothetical protein